MHALEPAARPSSTTARRSGDPQSAMSPAFLFSHLVFLPTYSRLSVSQVWGASGDGMGELQVRQPDHLLLERRVDQRLARRSAPPCSRETTSSGEIAVVFAGARGLDRQNYWCVRRWRWSVRWRCCRTGGVTVLLTQCTSCRAVLLQIPLPAMRLVLQVKKRSHSLILSPCSHPLKTRTICRLPR